jgi:hypothetical protein
MVSARPSFRKLPALRLHLDALTAEFRSRKRPSPIDTLSQSTRSTPCVGGRLGGNDLTNRLIASTALSQLPREEHPILPRDADPQPVRRVTDAESGGPRTIFYNAVSGRKEILGSL